MKQIKAKNTFILQCNRAIQLYYDAMKQYKYITMQLSKTKYIWLLVLPQQVEGLLGVIMAGIAVDMQTNRFIFWDKVLF